MRRASAVNMDWVPAHFPKDQFGLYNFDGEACYEDPNPKRGEHKEWGTMVFDFGRSEGAELPLISALSTGWSSTISTACVWTLVASMLYLDYKPEAGRVGAPTRDGRLGEP